jgi:hypothetical protein
LPDPVLAAVVAALVVSSLFFLFPGEQGVKAVRGKLFRKKARNYKDFIEGNSKTFDKTIKTIRRSS